ncbi:MAG: hypothetical protein Q9166_003668 [cf. Caloplaca sp. 2 TL-2023]
MGTTNPVKNHWIGQATLYVGEIRMPIYVNRDLLCSRSAHFKAALQGHFQEGQSNESQLADEDEDAIKLFCLWLENSKLDVPTNFDQLRVHVALVAFTRKILMDELSNHCLDNIRRYYKTELTSEFVREYYWDPTMAKEGWPKITAEGISLLYDHSVGTKLRLLTLLGGGSYHSLEIAKRRYHMRHPPAVGGRRILTLTLRSHATPFLA